MHKRVHRVVAGLALGISAAAAQGQEPPRLIVQITFDQLRGDLLQRFRPAFTGGFRRVLNDGYWVQKGEAAHALTMSWAGHSTLATGAFPSNHGFTANEFWQLSGTEWRSVSVVEDPRYRIVGRDSRAGLSLWQSQATSIGDWTKARSPQAKVIAIGSEVALAYAGRRPDGVYWLDSRAGGYTTSTAYRTDRPAWVMALNDRLRGLPREWTLNVPQRLQSLAAHPDDCPPLKATPPWTAGGARMLGPHVPEQGNAATPSQLLGWLNGTPLADELLLRNVRNIVAAEHLGQDSTTDYLALAIGATDSVGHEFGPVSLEQLDTLMRLDRALGAMLDDLDRSVGRGRYVVAISADHGSIDPPEQTCGRRVTTAEIEALLDRVEAIAKTPGLTEAQITERMVVELKAAPFVAEAYTQQAMAAAPDDPAGALLRQSFLPGRTTDFPLWTDKPRLYHPARYGITVIFKEGMVFDRARSVHGTPYAYDRLVPVIFYGADVPRRTVLEGARTVDVAPTLAALAKIEPDRPVDGKVLIAGDGE